MDKLFQGKRWVLLIRGILAIILGILMLVNIQNSVVGLLIFLGYYMIIEGIVKLSQAYVHRKSGEPFVPILLTGLGSIILGCLVFFWPGISAIVVIALIATNAIIQGITDIFTAATSREQLPSSWFWMLLLGGVAQTLFGIWIVLQPVIGGLTVVAVIGIYALVIGLVLIFRAFQVNSGNGSSGSVAIA